MAMKRIILLVLVLTVSTWALADSGTDWTQYSDEELDSTISELKVMIREAKSEQNKRKQGKNTSQKKEPEKSRQTQKEVRVPVGVWFIPDDIPAGHYTITVAPDQYMVWGSISVGTKLDETGKKIDSWNSKHRYYEQVKLKGSKAAVSCDEIDYDFKDGDILVIDEADMLFRPYEKKKLGF